MGSEELTVKYNNNGLVSRQSLVVKNGRGRLVEAQERDVRYLGGGGVGFGDSLKVGKVTDTLRDEEN